MWAGYMALVNQQAVANGNSTLGFINPTIYALGLGSGYDTDFHDITSGSNGYPAVTGYDLATGWGSPNGTGLINALAGTVPPRLRRHPLRPGHQHPLRPGHQHPLRPGHQRPLRPGHQRPLRPGHQHPLRPGHQHPVLHQLRVKRRRQRQHQAGGRFPRLGERLQPTRVAARLLLMCRLVQSTAMS